MPDQVSKVSLEIDERVKETGGIKSLADHAELLTNNLTKAQKALSKLNASADAFVGVPAGSPSTLRHGRVGSEDPKVARKEHRLDDTLKMMDYSRGEITAQNVLKYAHSQLGKRHDENLPQTLQLIKMAEGIARRAASGKVKDARGAMDKAVWAKYTKDGRTDQDFIMSHLHQRMTDPTLSASQQGDYAIKAAKEYTYHAQQATKAAEELRAAKMRELKAEYNDKMSPQKFGGLLRRANGVVGSAKTDKEKEKLNAEIERLRSRRDAERARAKGNTTEADRIERLGNAEANFAAGGRKDKRQLANELLTIAKDKDLSPQEKARIQARAKRLNAEQDAKDNGLTKPPSAGASDLPEGKTPNERRRALRERDLRDAAANGTPEEQNKAQRALKHLLKNLSGFAGDPDTDKNEEGQRAGYRGRRDERDAAKKLREKTSREQAKEERETGRSQRREWAVPERLFKNGQMPADKYKELLLKRLKDLKAGTDAWDKAMEEIRKAEQRMLEEMAAKKAGVPVSEIRKTPLLQIAEKFMGKDSKANAWGTAGATLSRLAPQNPFMQFGIDPMSAAQSAFQTYMQTEHNAMKGDLVLQSQAEYDKYRGKKNYDTQGDFKELNGQIIDAAVNRVPMEDGINKMMKIKEELANAGFSARDMKFNKKGAKELTPIDAMSRLSLLMPDIEVGELTQDIATTTKAMQNSILARYNKQHPGAWKNDVLDPSVRALPMTVAQISRGASMSSMNPADVMRTVRNIAGTGAVNKLSPEQIIALAVRTTDVGIRADKGSTAINSTLTMMSSASRSINEKTGKFSDKAGLLSRIMFGGRSEGEIKKGVLEFKKMFDTDAGEAVSRFLTRIQELNKAGANVPDALHKLGVGNIRTIGVLDQLTGADKRFDKDYKEDVKAIGTNPEGDFHTKTDGLTENEMAKYNSFLLKIQKTGIDFISSMNGPIEETLKIFTTFLTVLADVIAVFGKLPEPVKTAIVDFLALTFMFRTAAGALGGFISNGANAYKTIVAFQKMKETTNLGLALRQMFLNNGEAMAGVANQAPKTAGELEKIGVSAGGTLANLGKMSAWLGALASTAPITIPLIIAGGAAYLIKQKEIAESEANIKAMEEPVRVEARKQIDGSGKKIADLETYRKELSTGQAFNTVEFDQPTTDRLWKNGNTKQDDVLKVTRAGGTIDQEIASIRVDVKRNEKVIKSTEAKVEKELMLAGGEGETNKAVLQAALSVTRSRIGGMVGGAGLVTDILKKSEIISEGSDDPKELLARLTAAGGQQIPLGATGKYLSSAKPGDSLFLGKDKVQSGIYLGGGKMRQEDASGISTVNVKDAIKKYPGGAVALRMNGAVDNAGQVMANMKEKDLLDAADKDKNNRDALKREADRYSAKAENANSRYATAQGRWDELYYQADRHLKPLGRDELVKLAEQKRNAAADRDNNQLKAQGILKVGKDGKPVASATLAEVGGKLAAQRQLAFEKDLDKIDDQLFALRNKRLNNEAELLQAESRTKTAAKTDLETRLKLSLNIEEQHKLRQQILAKEKDIADVNYRAERKKIEGIRDEPQRKAAAKALDATYAAQKRGFKADGTKEGRDSILAKLDETNTMRGAMSWTDGSDMERTQREVGEWNDKIAADNEAKRKGLGGEMMPADRFAAEQKPKAIWQNYWRGQADLGVTIADQAASQARDPEQAYMLNDKKRQAEMYAFSKSADSKDKVKSVMLQNRQAEESRKDDLGRQQYRARQAFDKYGMMDANSPNGSALQNQAHDAYVAGMGIAKTDEERRGVGQNYTTSVSHALTTRYQATERLSKPELQMAMGQYSGVMQDAKNRGDATGYGDAAQEAYASITDLMDKETKRIDRLPENERNKETRAMVELISSIPEWQQLPEQLRSGITSAVKDSIEAMRMRNPTYKAAVESRRQLEGGTSSAVESAGSDLIADAFRKGSKNKAEAYKKFWDDILGVGTQSLSHFAWEGVLKPGLTSVFDQLKGELKEIWKGGEASWSSMVNLSLMAMNAAMLAGKGGKKAQKGAMWGTVLGGAAGFALGGPGGAMMGMNIGGATGAGYATGGIGGALMAGGSAAAVTALSGGFKGAGGGMGGVAKTVGTPGIGTPVTGFGGAVDNYHSATSGRGVTNVGGNRSTTVNINQNISASDKSTADYAASRTQQRTYRAVQTGN